MKFYINRSAAVTNPVGYSRLHITLHWVVFVLIVQQFLFNGAIVGAYEAMGQGQIPAPDPLVAAHVLGGMAVMVMAGWRLVLRARNGVPTEAGENAFLRLVARLTHWGLYALMVLLPVSGALAWFGGAEGAANAHGALRFLLLLLIVLHVAGALYHQFIVKDGVLNRMRRAGR